MVMQACLLYLPDIHARIQVEEIESEFNGSFEVLSSIAVKVNILYILHSPQTNMEELELFLINWKKKDIQLAIKSLSSENDCDGRNHI